HRGGHQAEAVIADGRPGAQRLSASQRWAFMVRVAIWLSCEMCSTPFGITEVGIPDRVAKPLAPCCAQRLSASQRWAFPFGHHPLATDLGAQRLSASQRWASKP